jgi:hypothetical protein
LPYFIKSKVKIKNRGKGTISGLAIMYEPQ